MRTPAFPRQTVPESRIEVQPNGTLTYLSRQPLPASLRTNLRRRAAALDAIAEAASSGDEQLVLVHAARLAGHRRQARLAPVA